MHVLCGCTAPLPPQASNNSEHRGIRARRQAPELWPLHNNKGYTYTAYGRMAGRACVCVCVCGLCWAAAGYAGSVADYCTNGQYLMAGKTFAQALEAGVRVFTQAKPRRMQEDGLLAETAPRHSNNACCYCTVGLGVFFARINMKDCVSQSAWQRRMAVSRQCRQDDIKVSDEI